MYLPSLARRRECGLTQTHTMTQQTAVRVEDAVGQSEDMDGQANELVQLMCFFKLG